MRIITVDLPLPDTPISTTVMVEASVSKRWAMSFPVLVLHSLSSQSITLPSSAFRVVLRRAAL
jgi:hypothetical protein